MHPRSWQRSMGQRQARRLAEAIHSLPERKPGASFRFGVTYNCGPERCIPYFPAAAAPEGGSGFAIGTENSALLYRAFQQAAAEVEADGSLSVLDAAQRCLHATFAAALGPVEELARQLAAATGQPYLGIDASIAPALERPSIPESYELLGLGPFGGCGTLAISGAVSAGTGGPGASSSWALRRGRAPGHGAGARRWGTAPGRSAGAWRRHDVLASTNCCFHSVPCHAMPACLASSLASKLHVPIPDERAANPGPHVPLPLMSPCPFLAHRTCHSSAQVAASQALRLLRADAPNLRGRRARSSGR